MPLAQFLASIVMTGSHTVQCITRRRRDSHTHQARNVQLQGIEKRISQELRLSRLLA